MMIPLKWITGILELILAIPVVGATIVIKLHWIPLGIMLILHVITLIVTARSHGKYGSSILGIVTSCVAWIPFIGWIMHLITAIMLMISAATTGRENKAPIVQIFNSAPNTEVKVTETE